MTNILQVLCLSEEKKKHLKAQVQLLHKFCLIFGKPQKRLHLMKERRGWGGGGDSREGIQNQHIFSSKNQVEST